MKEQKKNYMKNNKTIFSFRNRTFKIRVLHHQTWTKRCLGLIAAWWLMIINKCSRYIKIPNCWPKVQWDLPNLKITIHKVTSPTFIKTNLAKITWVKSSLRWLIKPSMFSIIIRWTLSHKTNSQLINFSSQRLILRLQSSHCSFNKISTQMQTTFLMIVAMQLQRRISCYKWNFSNSSITTRDPNI